MNDLLVDFDFFRMKLTINVLKVAKLGQNRQKALFFRPKYLYRPCLLILAMQTAL